MPVGVLVNSCEVRILVELAVRRTAQYPLYTPVRSEFRTAG